MVKKLFMNFSFGLIASLLICSVIPQAQAAGNGAYRVVKVHGRQLMVDFDKDGIYESYLIKGVAYDPMPVGRHMSDWGWPAGYPQPDNILSSGDILQRDMLLIQGMNANTIRLWKANDTESADGRFPNKMTHKTLAIAGEHHLKVIAGFEMGWAGQFQCDGSVSKYTTFIDYTNKDVRHSYVIAFRNFVSAFRNDPNILFWAVGNENNMSLNPADSKQVKAYYSLVNFMAAEAHAVEGGAYHPVAIVDGGVNFIGQEKYGTRDVDLPDIDIWGANAYFGKTFGSLFENYKGLSKKPLWISEFGADAFDNARVKEDQKAQSEWDTNLWNEIMVNRNVAVGGTVMEYADEWWKPNEWNCEESKEDCRTVINRPEAVFYWDLRPLTGSYTLSARTNSGPFFSGTVFDTQIKVDNIPLKDGKVSVDLVYRISPDTTITEHNEYETGTNTKPLPAPDIRVKIRRPGSFHNTFGFGPQDWSCPLDGKIDYYPAAPDHFLNEEYWGLVSIARDGYNVDKVTPRQAYESLKERFAVSLPWRYHGPRILHPVGATAILALQTDVNAVCRYETAPGVLFDHMRYTFEVTGGKTHSQLITGLTSGTYTYYVRCKDSSRYKNPDDYPITFSISAP